MGNKPLVPKCHPPPYPGQTPPPRGLWPAVSAVGGGPHRPPRIFTQPCDRDSMSPPQVLRVFLLILVMITVSSYTANLAAFLTKPNFQLHGPSSMQELKQSAACFTTGGRAPAAYVNSHIQAGGITDPFPDRQAICHQALRNGTSDVWLADYSALNYYLFKNFEGLAFVESIKFSPVYFAFAVRAPLRDFGHNLSMALIHYQKQPAFTNLLMDSFAIGRSLPESCSMRGADDMAPITVEGMKGLFLIVACGFGFALLLAVGQCLLSPPQSRRKRDPAHDHPFEHTLTEGEMLRHIMRKVDGMTQGHHRTVAPLPALDAA